MDDNSTMLPCPKCGSRKISLSVCEPECCGAKPLWIDCECGITFGFSKDVSSREDAIKEWNYRNYNSDKKAE